MFLQPQEPQEEAPEQKAEAENVLTVAKDPRYARYLKMVQVVSHYMMSLFTKSLILGDFMSRFFKGVPVMAIRNKMILEGLDPNLLE